MVMLARAYLGLTLLLLAGVGFAGLLVPDTLVAQFDLLPQSAKGSAEVRGLYGGAFLSWGLIIVGAWRYKHLRNGLLVALALTMGTIAAARLVSLAVDQQPAFNIPAIVSELLIVLACWILYRDETTRS